MPQHMYRSIPITHRPCTEITGTEMKKIKTYFNKTSIIDNIEIQTGGLTLQDVVDKYGKELNADAMEELATTGKY